jgi:hypothetical protein
MTPYFKSHTVGSDRDAAAMTQGLLDTIRARGSVTPRELMRLDRVTYPNARVATEALEALVAEGLAWVERIEPGKTGGRPSVRYMPCDKTPLQRLQEWFAARRAY